MAPRDPHLPALARFLSPDGLGAVLAAGFPVVSADGLVALSCEGFSLAPPRHAEVDVARLGVTHGRALSLTVRLTVYGDASRAPSAIADIREQDLYLGLVPLLTREGVWCIDGTRRAPRRRLSLAPGPYPAVVDELPALCLRPQHGAAITLWRDPHGALRVRFEGRDHDGDLWLRALDLDPHTLTPRDGGDAAVRLGRALHPDDAGRRRRRALRGDPRAATRRALLAGPHGRRADRARAGRVGAPRRHRPPRGAPRVGRARARHGGVAASVAAPAGAPRRRGPLRPRRPRRPGRGARRRPSSPRPRHRTHGRGGAAALRPHERSGPLAGLARGRPGGPRGGG